MAELEQRLAAFWLDFDGRFKGRDDPAVAKLAYAYGVPGNSGNPRPGHYWVKLCDSVDRGTAHATALATFVEQVRPMSRDIDSLAGMQLDAFDAHGLDAGERVQAFIAFGSGRLRSGVHQHVMDKVESANEQYHAWFAIARAARHFATREPETWLRMAGLIGLAFEIHWTLGVRKHQTPQVDAALEARLRAKWQADEPAAAVSEEKLDLHFWELLNG